MLGYHLQLDIDNPYLKNSVFGVGYKHNTIDISDSGYKDKTKLDSFYLNFTKEF